MVTPINFATLKLQEKSNTLEDCRDTIDSFIEAAED